MSARRARRSLGRREVLAGVISSLAAPAVVRAMGTNGVALVIGNSKYKWEASLPNVRRDAPDMARAFQGLGLKTELLQDADRDAMRRAIDRFAAASRSSDFAAFYFAGHGITWEGVAYLVPVDSDLSNPGAVQGLILSLSVAWATKGAANRLLVFDNCRNSPADGWPQVETERLAVFGSSPITDLRSLVGGNVLSLSSTGPGRIARDGPAGENSPFAAVLLRRLEGDSIDIQTLPASLRRDLLIATEGRQVLWGYSTYDQPFLLKAPRNRPSVAATESEWRQDPSRIVELTNAYDFARQSGLPLPPGLLAYRPASESRHSQKIGTYKFTSRRQTEEFPMVLVVMSVAEKTAEIVVAGRGGFNLRSGKFEEAIAYWRLVTATLSGSTLEYVPRDRASRYAFDWNGANPDGMTQFFDLVTPAGGEVPPPRRSHFTRLDG